MSFWTKSDKPDFPAEAQPGAPATAPYAAPPAPPAPSPASAAPAAAIAAPPAPAPAPVEKAAPAAARDLRLGRGVRLEGKLTFSGTVRIDATFQGSIVTDGVLVVGEDAKVDAEISCGTVIVDGEVNGNVVATSEVELHASARLHGDVESPALAIDRGAIFEGSSRRPSGAASWDRRAARGAGEAAHPK